METFVQYLGSMAGFAGLWVMAFWLFHDALGPIQRYHKRPVPRRDARVHAPRRPSLTPRSTGMLVSAR